MSDYRWKIYENMLNRPSQTGYFILYIYICTPSWAKRQIQRATGKRAPQHFNTSGVFICSLMCRSVQHKGLQIDTPEVLKC